MAKDTAKDITVGEIGMSEKEAGTVGGVDAKGEVEGEKQVLQSTTVVFLEAHKDIYE